MYFANIHLFDKIAYEDEDGEPYFGYYYEIVDDSTGSLTGLIGPYGSSDEVEEACKLAFDRGDY